MKPITAIIVFFSLMFPALFLGYDNNRLCLSRKGIFVSDGIISDLMFVEE